MSAHELVAPSVDDKFPLAKRPAASGNGSRLIIVHHSLVGNARGEWQEICSSTDIFAGSLGGQGLHVVLAGSMCGQGLEVIFFVSLNG